jgi:hypothetical protein
VSPDTCPRSPPHSGGQPKGVILETLKRVPNFRLDPLIRDCLPFENYNRSIIGQRTSYLFMLFHWDTCLLMYDTETKELLRFDFDYYSQTTSTLQGRIVRNLLSREQIEHLLDTYKQQGETAKFRRLRGMARIR